VGGKFPAVADLDYSRRDRVRDLYKSIKAVYFSAA
jgi:hypothetical protein